jgi:hypothetical protein
MRTKNFKKNLKKILLLLAIACLVSATVKPGPGFRPISMMNSSRYFQDLGEVFDFSRLAYPVTVSTDQGQALNFTQPFLTKTFNASLYNYKNLNFAKAMSSNLVALLYDDTHLIVQPLGPNTKEFQQETLYELSSSVGADYTCSDAVYNEVRNYIYVGCFETGTGAGTKNLKIISVNLKQGTQTVLTVPQDDGFVVKNRLMMFLIYAPQETLSVGNIQDHYLITYDQGNSHSQQSKGNNHIRVFRNVYTRALKFYKTLTIDTPQLTAVYDFLPYQQSLIVTARLPSLDRIVSMVECTIDLSKDNLKCDTDFFKPTGIVEGYIGIFNENQYFQIDTLTNEINVANLFGDFHNPDWNTDIIQNFLGSDLFQDPNTWIRFFSGNEYVGVINWAQTASSDFGVTLISWGEDESWKVQGATATAIGEIFLHGSTDSSKGIELAMTWSRGPYLVIDGSVAPIGASNVTVTVEDISGQPVTEVLQLSVLDSVWQEIDIEKPAQTISIESGKTVHYPLADSDVISGNGLTVEVTSSDPSVLTATGATYNMLNLTWSPDPDFSQIMDVMFFGQQAAVINVNQIVEYYDCAGNIPTMTCTKFGYTKYGKQERFSTYMKKIENVTLIWSHDRENTYLYFYGEDGSTFKRTVKGIAYDLVFIPNNQISGYIGVVFKDTVVFYVAIFYDLTAIEVYQTLSLGNSHSEKFCPRQIQLCPSCNQEVEIMSVCQADQRILSYTLHDLEFLSNTPVADHTYNAEFCSTRGIYIVSSNVGDEEAMPVYGLNKANDLTYVDTPLGDFDFNLGTQFYCVSTANKVVIVSDEPSRLTKVMVVIRGGHKYFPAKRYPVVLKGVDAKLVTSYQFNGDNLIHVLNNNDGKYEFMASYSTPQIFMTAGTVTQATNVTATITFKSLNGQTLKMEQSVSVTPAGTIEKKRLFKVE